MKFLKEMKRRKVFRVGATYSVVAWLLIQVVNNIAGPLNMPPWVPTVVIVLLGIGFPLALVLAWSFEVTPEGFKRQPKMKPGASHAPLAIADYALIVLMAGIIWVSYLQFGERAFPFQDPGAPGREDVEAQKASVAVLRFTNMSPDPDQAYFAEGISEEILNQLAGYENLRVISRTSSFSFSSENTNMAEIADKLGATFVIEGSVRKAQNRVRITAQLIEVASDSHIWSDTFDRELKDIFKIQEEIAVAITGSIQNRLGVSLLKPSTKMNVENFEAYEAFLKGRYFSRLRFGRENVEKAISLLEKAVKLDANYSEAWALLASNYLQMPSFDPQNFKRWVEATDKAAQTALLQDPENPLALAVLGMNKEPGFKWQESRKYLKRAAGMKTTEAESVYWFGLHLAGMGYLKEGLEQVLKARARDPLNPNIYRWASNIAQELGDYDKGRQYANLAIQYGQPGFIGDLVLIDLKEGKFEDALARDLPNGYVNREIVKAIGAGEGRKKIREFITQRGEEVTPTFEQLALIAGAWDLALQEFRLALLSEHPIGGTNYMVSLWGPEAAPMRKMDTFKTLVRDLGLPEYWDVFGWPEFCQPAGEDDFECH